MSEDWPDSLRCNSRVALNPLEPVATRCQALRVLQDALDTGEILDESQRNRVLCLFASFVSDDAQEIAIAATEALLPTVQHTAERIRSLHPGPVAMQMVEEAEALIWKLIRAGKFDANGGKFEGWCFTVLQNDLITRHRRQRNDPLCKSVPLTGISADAEAVEDFRSSLEQAIDSQTIMAAPFSRADLEAIEGLPPMHRLVLLSLLGLWRKIPPKCWRQWVEDAKAAEPFPPDGFGELETCSARHQCLAGALRLNPLTVTQWWQRGRRGVLARLECIRNLRDEHQLR